MSEKALTTDQRLVDGYLVDLLFKSGLAFRPGWMLDSGGNQRPIAEVRRFAELLLNGRAEQEVPRPATAALVTGGTEQAAPVPMLLWCPECGDRHIDVGEFATKVHHTHACQNCGMVWRPAVGPTVGVQWLPGFKDRGVL